MRLTLELERAGPVPPLPGDGAALVAFMSFAISRGFGATHPLIALADRLHDTLHVRLGPLTTFYDAEAEDSEDRAKLALAWQDPAPLRESLQAVASAIRSDAQCQALAHRAGTDELGAQAAALIPALCDAEAAGERVRLVYCL